MSHLQIIGCSERNHFSFAANMRESDTDNAPIKAIAAFSLLFSTPVLLLFFLQKAHALDQPLCDLPNHGGPLTDFKERSVQ
jgi:hypothetical protein